jgi:hypothetical protein
MNQHKRLQEEICDIIIEMVYSLKVNLDLMTVMQRFSTGFLMCPRFHMIELPCPLNRNCPLKSIKNTNFEIVSKIVNDLNFK